MGDMKIFNAITMRFNMNIIFKLTGLFSIILLVACGGENSNSVNEMQIVESKQAEVTYKVVVGTAFSNSALNGANVTAICKDGAGFKNPVVVNAQGQWQGEVDSSKLPCRLQVKANGQSYHSYIDQERDVNINPLTDMVVAYASNQVPATWYQSGTMTTEKLNSANSALVAELIKKGYGINNDEDLFNAEMKANSPIHRAIQGLLEAIKNNRNIKDYDALLMLIKDGNLSQLPMKSDQFLVNPLNINIDTTACQQYDSGMIERYNYCASNVLPDFKEDQLITPFGEKCILTKVGNTLTVSNGKLTISTIINKDENDQIPSKTSTGTLFVASNPVSSTVEDILYNIGISFLADGQINGISAGNGKGEALVCSTTRSRT
jgi:hypothetical protein